jgi:hypothetical protein
VDERSERDRFFQQSVEAANRIVGFPGAMVAQTKTRFRAQHPDDVVFNANVAVAELGKARHGDFWLTRDHQRLSDLTAAIEPHGRLENADRPPVRKAVATFEPDGQIRLDPKVATWLDGHIVWTHPRRRSKQRRKR